MQWADYTHHVSCEERRLARREDRIEHALLPREGRHRNSTEDATRRGARCETVGRVTLILSAEKRKRGGDDLSFVKRGLRGWVRIYVVILPN